MTTKKDKEPREISERIKMWGSKWDYEVSIDYMSFEDMEELMADVKQKNPQYTKLYFDNDYHEGLYIRGVRPETQEEVDARIQKELDRKQKAMDKELKELERLKKKFEGK